MKTLLIALMLISPIQPGWVKQGDNWFYYREDGVLQGKGWFKEGGNYYYAKEDGSIYTNAMIQFGPDNYYVNGSGKMVRNNWVKHNSKWYFFMPDGKMLRSCWLELQDGTYYATSYGWIYTDGIYNIAQKYYKFDASGRMTKEYNNYDEVGVIAEVK